MRVRGGGVSDFLALAAVCDDDLFCGLAALGSKGLNLLDYVHALNNLGLRKLGPS